MLLSAQDLPTSRRRSLEISPPERFCDRRWAKNISSRSSTRSAATRRFASPLLGCWVATIELRCEHLLRRHAGLVKGYSPVPPDRVLAQLGAGTAGAVENDEHLAARRRDLDAEAGVSGVPVDDV